METTKTYVLYVGRHGRTDSAEFGYGDYANHLYTPLAITSASSATEATRKFRNSKKFAPRPYNKVPAVSDWYMVWEADKSMQKDVDRIVNSNGSPRDCRVIA